MQRPDLSVVILSWNTRAMLRACLESLPAGAGGVALEVICVDNASEDGSAEMVEQEFPQVRLQRSAVNEGYACGVNRGLALAAGERVALLGSDTELRPGALQTLCAFLDAHPGAGAVAPRLVGPDGGLQQACMRFPDLKTALWWDTPLQLWFPKGRELARYQMQDWDHRGTRRVDQPPGTCLVLSRRALEAVGPMDPRLWLFFNDVDWALRLRDAGFETWYVDEAEVMHHGGGSTRNFADFGAEWHRNRVAFYKKHFHTAGSLLTKAVAVYAALRQCWRIKQELPWGREYRAHARAVLGALGTVLRT